MKSASSGALGSRRRMGCVVIGDVGVRRMPVVQGGAARGGFVEKRILPVEDDQSLARSIVEGLSDEGFTVAHAADGEAAGNALGPATGTW